MTRVLMFLVHNWPLKLAAVVLATLLYGVFILTQDSRQITSTVPIDPRGQPEGLEIVSDLGVVRSIRYFASDDGVRPDSSTFRAFVDFRGVTARAGSVVLNVTVESIDERIDVLTWEPRQINVAIDELVSRNVPVHVEVGQPPEDLDVREPEVDVETVAVRGASADVARVDRAEGRVQIQPGGVDIERDVTLVPVDAQGEPVLQVDVEPSTVRVRIAIFRDRQTRSLPVDPVLSGDPAPGFEIARIEVDPVVVLLEGDDDQLRALRRAETQPVALTGATDTVEEIVALNLPTGVLPVDVETVTVTVTLRQVTATRSFTAAIDLEGEQSGLDYSVSATAVVASIGGSIADLDRLEGRTFTVEVSVAGLGPGEHSVPVTADLPAGLTLVSANPPRVTVAIVPVASPSPPAVASPSPPPAP